MTSAFDDEPNVMLSRKIDSFLHIFDASCIDYINRISFPTAWSQRTRQTGVIVPVVIVGADGIVRMED